MRNCGGAVIPMQQALDNVQFLVGSKSQLDEIRNVPALPVFLPRMIKFFSALSNAILKDSRSRDFTHVTAYAYWIRRASLEKERLAREEIIDSRLGRGIVFHIAPSNIPLAFAMSFTIASMAGNVNIVRISSRQFTEVEIVCDAMKALLDKDYQDLQNYFFIMRYPHDDETTKFFSALCDVRVIWGGDETINTIRRIPIPPRTVEFTFADRHSIALIQSEKYLELNASEVAKKFYADTYDVDQNACSSPRAVIWIGKSAGEAKKIFWESIGNLVHNRYEMPPIQAIEKFSAACMVGMKKTNVRLIPNDNFITLIEVDSLQDDLTDLKPGGGYFVEYTAENLAEIVPLLNKQCQTLAVIGFEPKKLREWIISMGLRGVDRIVEFGETMRLDFVWDGFDLIREMSRYIEA